MEKEPDRRSDRDTGLKGQILESWKSMTLVDFLLEKPRSTYYCGQGRKTIASVLKVRFRFFFSNKRCCRVLGTHYNHSVWGAPIMAFFLKCNSVAISFLTVFNYFGKPAFSPLSDGAGVSTQ